MEDLYNLFINLTFTIAYNIVKYQEKSSEPYTLIKFMNLLETTYNDDKK